MTYIQELKPIHDYSKIVETNYSIFFRKILPTKIDHCSKAVALLFCREQTQLKTLSLCKYYFVSINKANS